jgi:hypothetical protein
MQNRTWHFENNPSEPPGPPDRSASAIFPSTSILPIGDSTLPWVPFTPYCERVEFKYFRFDSVRSEIVCLVRAPAGLHMPQRYHYGRIITHTIEGSWKFLECDWTAERGSTVFEPPACIHTPQALGTTGYCVTLNIISGDMILLTAGGDAPVIENWRSALQRYLAYCERASIQPADLSVCT